jgi:O-antigen/teichoic acid export membrane protein
MSTPDDADLDARAANALAGGSGDRAVEDRRRSEVLGMARQGGLNFGGAIFNQALRFAITFVVARLLGATVSGLYFQSFAILAFLSLVASAAATDTLTRFVAVHRADGDDAAVQGTIRIGLLATAALAAIMGVALFVSAPWLAENAFHDERLAALLRFVAVALPATAYTDAALGATRGFKTMKPYAFINLFFEPACRIVLTLALIWAGFGLLGVMTALLVTNTASAILASLALRRLMGRSELRPRYHLREIVSFSASSWLSHVASNGLLWADTILLGIYGSVTAVGVYQVATRLTLLATVFITPVTNSFAPRIADLYRRQRFDLLRRSFELITSWVVRLSLPAFVVLLVFPRELLAIFGPSFEAGVAVTVIMTVAWLFNAISGPCGYMLTMSGRPRIQMANYIVALALNVGLNIVLIPRFGISGAAIAWGSTVVMLTLSRMIQVWAFLGMLPFSRHLLKGFIAGLASGLVAAVIRHAMGGGPASLVVGAAATAAVYVAGIRLLGIEADDRVVLDAVRERFRLRRA